MVESNVKEVVNFINTCLLNLTKQKNVVNEVVPSYFVLVLWTRLSIAFTRFAARFKNIVGCFVNFNGEALEGF